MYHLSYKIATGLVPTKTALGTCQHGSAGWDACGGSLFLRTESRGGLGVMEN